ncbi:MAG: twitching motility protein PilT, partial [Burkholderiaceae bacterium]
AQMYSAIQTGGSLGMQTLDASLQDLVRKHRITAAVARASAKLPENF